MQTDSAPEKSKILVNMMEVISNEGRLSCTSLSITGQIRAMLKVGYHHLFDMLGSSTGPSYYLSVGDCKL